ncbi:MAG: 6-phosphogluconolactonase [Chloroflexi bacterium]|nr:6-phosphogluconolactonase [Chloroflexota bacterium]
MQDSIDIYPDVPELVRAVAGQIVAAAAGAIAQHGRFSIGLCGSTTPRPLFELLAGDEFAPQIAWGQVHVFFGDERSVPPDHADSNYRQARVLLLDQVPIPPGQVHRMRGEAEPVEAAAEYEAVLRRYFGPDATLPRFDVLLQGMGPDGHTASLFPHSAALHEDQRWVVAHYVEKLDTWRITLTPPAINAAAQVIFMVSGEAKAEMLDRVISGPYQPDELPSQLIQPRDGVLRWMVDEAAASRLRGD